MQQTLERRRRQRLQPVSVIVIGSRPVKIVLSKEPVSELPEPTAPARFDAWGITECHNSPNCNASELLGSRDAALPPVRHPLYSEHCFPQEASPWIASSSAFQSRRIHPQEAQRSRVAKHLQAGCLLRSLRTIGSRRQPRTGAMQRTARRSGGNASCARRSSALTGWWVALHCVFVLRSDGV